MGEITLSGLLNQIVGGSIEITGVKDRVFTKPLSEEDYIAWQDLNDGTEQDLFAASRGIIEKYGDESVLDVYGEVVAVALVTHKDMPSDFVKKVADAVINATAELYDEDEPIDGDSIPEYNEGDAIEDLNAEDGTTTTY